MANNIVMQQLQGDGSYNTLYPVTNASNVNYTNSSLSGVDDVQGGLDSVVSNIGNINTNLGNYFTKTQTLTSSTAALFGLSDTAVPDDVLQILTSAALYKSVSTRNPVQLNSKSIGDIIKLTHNGTVKEFLIMQKNYESGLNGPNRVLLIQTEREGEVQWDSDGSANYSLSTIDDLLNSSYKQGFDASIQSLISQTSFKYYPSRTASIATLSRSIFLLSCTEFGVTNLTTSVTGSAGTKVDGADNFWTNYFVKDMMNHWTRSCSRAASSRIIALYAEGDSYTEPYGGVTTPSNDGQYYPSFTLPGNVTLYEDGNGVIHAENNYSEAITDVLGNILMTLPTVQIETGSYVGKGTSGSSNPNSLTFDFTPQLLIISDIDPNNLPDVGPARGIFWKSMPLNTLIYTGNLTTRYSLQFTKWGNTISWYASDAADQFNVASTNGKALYYYIAVG